MKKAIYWAIIFYMAQVFGDNGTTGATFLTLDAGARNGGMAGSGTALFTGVQSLLWNPANIGWLNGRELLCAHSEHFQSIRYENIGFANGKNNLGLGFSLKGLYLGGLEERTEPSADPISIMNAYFLSPAFSLARAISPKISLGINLKSIYQQIGKNNSFALATDLGIHTRSPVKNLNLGFSFLDLGTKFRFISESNSLPTRFRAGLSYTFQSFSLAFDLIRPLKEDIEYSAGIEGIIKDELSLRLGYKGAFNGAEDFRGFAWGLGFRLQDLDIDYALVGYGGLGATHTFSLSYIWGRNERARVQKEEMLAEKFNKRIKDMAYSFYTRGVEAEKIGNYEDAWKNFELSLVWYPDYEEASSYLDNLRKKKLSEYLRSGYEAYKENNFIKAINWFARAVEIDSTDKMATGWLKASLAALTKSTTENIKEEGKKGRISYYIRLGGEHFSKKNYAGAIKEWQNALNIDTSQILIRDLIGRAKLNIREEIDTFVSQKRWHRASLKIEELWILEPGDQELLQKKNKIEKELNNFVLAHINDGIKLFTQKNYTSARAEFRIVSLLQPKNLTAKHYLAKINSMGDIKPSIAELHQIYEKGISAYTQNNYEIAIEYWKCVNETRPGYLGVQKSIQHALEKNR
uniref:PorV/PorQ family protein n=1 Tax=candidate division WOR-3 bacterium TaxID=2052148 RepID=A0A7C4TIJ9_UNCW3